FIGWVVLFRPRRHPIFAGLSRTSTARRLVLPLSSPTSRALTTARPTVPKRQRRDAGGESSRRVTGAEDAAEGVREWGLALEERGARATFHRRRRPSRPSTRCHTVYEGSPSRGDGA